MEYATGNLTKKWSQISDLRQKWKEKGKLICTCDLQQGNVNWKSFKLTSRKKPPETIETLHYKKSLLYGDVMYADKKSREKTAHFLSFRV